MAGKIESVEVKSAEVATAIAQSVLESEYAFRRPIKAQKVKGVWHVQIDVGAFKPQIASFKIDAQTGTIIEYNVSGVLS